MAAFSEACPAEGLNRNKCRAGSRLHCCVPMCNGDSRYEDLSYHGFPKEKDLRAEWIVKIRRDEGPYFKITDNTRVCSRHFQDNDYKNPSKAGLKLLISGAVPSIFKWSGATKHRRTLLRHVNSAQTNKDGDEDVTAPLQPGPMDVDQPETEIWCADGSNQMEVLQTAYCRAQEEIIILKEQLAASQIYRFGLERFSSDNESIKFYSGFATYKHLYTFYEFVKPTAEHMIYVYSTPTNPSRPGARSILLIDEHFLFLVRIRLGLFEQDLAHRFGISVSSVSRKVTTWANYLYFLLGTQPIWPSREQIDLYMPQPFRDEYPSTRVILDCTEISVQTPSSILLQSQMYSSYKSNTTVKGLIGIAPHGAVTFVSSLYTGGVSDREITRCSGVLDLLEANDSVMADKGFNIEELLAQKKVKLNIPPFLKGQCQFSAAEVKKTKNIAKLRIH